MPPLVKQGDSFATCGMCPPSLIYEGGRIPHVAKLSPGRRFLGGRFCPRHRLIVLYPKQNISSELKIANLFWYGAKAKFSYSSGERA